MLAFDVYRHWETDLRPFTINALKRMSPEQLRFKPEGYHSSALDLAEHMAQAEWVWIYRNVLQRAPWSERWEKGRFTALEELLSYWSDIHRQSIEWLRETPLTELNRQCPLPYTDLPWTTLNWVIYHVIEHEAHHRGQIFLLMRLQGVTPPEL